MDRDCRHRRLPHDPADIRGFARRARLATSWGDLKIKPGDRAALYLAGLKVCDGYIIKRWTTLNANSHEVVVEGASKEIDLQTSAKPKQYRGYTLEAICNSLMKDQACR